jgi:HSP20 family protein
MTNQPETPTKAAETPKEISTRPRTLRIPDFFDEMDRFWGQVMPARWRSAFGRGQPMPALDVFEKEGKLHVEAELPGMQDKDIEIEITDDALTISGEKKEEREVKEDNYYRSERSYGMFRRQVVLPAGADTDHAEAKFKDGVLKIEIPVKAAETAKKKIEVKAD